MNIHIFISVFVSQYKKIISKSMIFINVFNLIFEPLKCYRPAGRSLLLYFTTILQLSPNLIMTNYMFGYVGKVYDS